MSWTKHITSSDGSTTSQWANKKVNWLGDSITRGWGTTGGNTPFHTYLNNRIGFAASRNYGDDGSTISDGDTPMYSRATTIDVDADLICVFGGTNDWGNTDRLIGEMFTVSAGTRTPNTDVTTFYGALHTLCKNLISRFPDKKIFFITPIHRVGEFTANAAGHYLEDYVVAVKNVCKWYSIPVLDLWAEGGMQPNESIHKSTYVTDGTHPNDKGHVLLADKIEKFINGL